MAPPPHRPSAPPAPRRVATLDVARALGVVAMVAGHTLDATLASALRASPAAVLYWKARGLTAPLFLLVSGWAVALALTRARARATSAARSRIARAALLLAIGVTLRFPGWDVDGLLAGDPAPWAHLLAFDALHVIAVSLLATAGVWALPLSARERGLALGLVAVLSVALGMRAPAPPATGLAALAVQQATGGTSPFPVFPWSAYFFAGAILGIASQRHGSRAVRLAGAGGLVVALGTVGLGVGTMPPAHPILILFRIGAVLALLAALSAAPERLARAVAPLGRASLGVYAIHVPIVYGWSTWQGIAFTVGPTLGAGEALACAAFVLAASLAILAAGRLAGRQARLAWGRRAAIAEALGGLLARIAGARPR